MTLAPRRALPIVAAVLAIGGVAAIAVGRHDSPPAEPPLSVAPPAAASVSAAPSGGQALTTGPLLPTSPPTMVDIPALRAKASIVALGRQADGSMQVPADAATVGWYTKAPTPGSLGPAILAGHVNFHGADGTFARLAALKAGDEVHVARQDGTTAVFRITRVDRYAKDHFPTAAVYGPINHAGLRLITCGGDFDSRSGHYVDNIVAYADLRGSPVVPE